MCTVLDVVGTQTGRATCFDFVRLSAVFRKYRAILKIVIFEQEAIANGKSSRMLHVFDSFRPTLFLSSMYSNF